MQKERIQARKKIKRANSSSLSRDTILYVAIQGPNHEQKSYVATEDSMSRHIEHEEGKNAITTETSLSRHSLLQHLIVG